MLKEGETKTFTWEDFADWKPNSETGLVVPEAWGLLALPEQKHSSLQPMTHKQALGRRRMLATSATTFLALNFAVNGASLPTVHATDKVKAPSLESVRINQLLQRGTAIESPLGHRLIDEELEEYILVLDPTMTNRIKETEISLSIVQIPDQYINEETGLRNECYVMHDRRQGRIGQDYAIKWAVGDFENPNGLWMTEWFGEDQLQKINWLYAKWHTISIEQGQGTFMENVQFIDAQSQKLTILQRFSVPPRRLPGVIPPRNTN